MLFNSIAQFQNGEVRNDNWVKWTQNDRVTAFGIDSNIGHVIGSEKSKRKAKKKERQSYH